MCTVPLTGRVGHRRRWKWRAVPHDMRARGLLRARRWHDASETMAVAPQIAERLAGPAATSDRLRRCDDQHSMTPVAPLLMLAALAACGSGCPTESSSQPAGESSG